LGLDVPSGSSAGLKVFISPPLTVTSGVSEDLLLDIDLAQSFEPIPGSAVQAPDITTFHFHPVLRVANVSTVGRIDGVVTSLSEKTPIANATVTASNGTTTGVALTGNDGSYAILGLAPGSYTVTVEAVAFMTTSASTSVAAGSVTTFNVALGP
jgi:hypothetical protein